MISRVLYGLATQGNLPKVLTHLNARTGTPLLTTAIGVAAILALAPVSYTHLDVYKRQR